MVRTTATTFCRSNKTSIIAITTNEISMGVVTKYKTKKCGSQNIEERQYAKYMQLN